MKTIIAISLVIIPFLGIIFIYDLMIKKSTLKFLNNCKKSVSKSKDSKKVKKVFNMLIIAIEDNDYPSLILFYKKTVEKEFKLTGDFIIKRYQFLIKK